MLCYETFLKIISIQKHQAKAPPLPCVYQVYSARTCTIRTRKTITAATCQKSHGKMWVILIGPDLDPWKSRESTEKSMISMIHSFKTNGSPLNTGLNAPKRKRRILFQSHPIFKLLACWPLKLFDVSESAKDSPPSINRSQLMKMMQKQHLGSLWGWTIPPTRFSPASFTPWKIRWVGRGSGFLLGPANFSGAFAV